MSFEIVAHGVPPSLGEYLRAETTPESELPELPQEGTPGGFRFPMPEIMRRRRSFARELARKAEEHEAARLGSHVEGIVCRAAPEYRLTRVVKRGQPGWHLLFERWYQGAVVGFHDVYLDEMALGGRDSDRTRLDRLPSNVLQETILTALRQQQPERTAS